MAAGLTDIIEALDLATLVELVNQNYVLSPEEKPSILQRFEEKLFSALPEDNLDPMTFSETLNQKLDILFDIYQTDPEILQHLILLRAPQLSSERAIPVDSEANISESEQAMLEQAMLEQAIVLSLTNPENDSPKSEFDSAPSLWQGGVSIKKYLLDIFSQRINTEAAKGAIDRRRLALLLPRLFTPNQDLVKSSEDGPEILDRQYAARIPANIFKRLELLSEQILHIVNAVIMPLSEKITNIAFLYQIGEKELRAEVEKLFLDEDESSPFIDILLKEVKLSEQEKTEFTREFIRLKIINTYLLMCFQFMNVKIQYRISEQSYEYKDVIITSIGFIGQQLQVLSNKETLMQVVMNRVKDHLIADKENGQGGWKDFNDMPLKKPLVKELEKKINELSTFLHADPKYEPIIKLLSAVDKTDNYEKYCLDLVILLQGMLPPPGSSKMVVGNRKGTTEFPKKMLSWLSNSDEKLRKKVASIISNDKDLQEYIHQAEEIVKKINALELECVKKRVAYNDALEQVSVAATGIIAPISLPIHSAPAAVTTSTLSFGSYRARVNAAAESSIPASSGSASAAPAEAVSVDTAIGAAPVQHSAPATTRLDSAGSHRRYAFVGQARVANPEASASENSGAVNLDTVKNDRCSPK